MWSMWLSEGFKLAAKINWLLYEYRKGVTCVRLKQTVPYTGFKGRCSWRKIATLLWRKWSWWSCSMWDQFHPVARGGILVWDSGKEWLYIHGKDDPAWTRKLVTVKVVEDVRCCRYTREGIGKRWNQSRLKQCVCYDTRLQAAVGLKNSAREHTSDRAAVLLLPEQGLPYIKGTSPPYSVWIVHNPIVWTLKGSTLK